MSLSPRLSVLMSVYNGEDYLAESIDSILSQTFEDYEFIIIDDGSTDSTSSILSSYAKKNMRIRIITNEKNIGLIRSLNKGLYMASSNLVARMDADDIAIPERFEIQMDFMRDHPNVAVCGGFTTYLENPAKGDVHAINHEDIVAECFFHCPFAHPTVIMRKDKILELTDGYDPNDLYAEDYGLWSRLVISKKIKFANINKSLLKYRTHPNNPRIEYKKKQKETANDIQRKMFLSLGINIPLKDIDLLNHSEGKISIDNIKKCESWLLKIERSTDNMESIERIAFLKEIKDKKMYLWRRIRKNSVPAILRYITARFYYRK
ncbi:glycosyltransferase [Xenorhabdus koppenhoeferi]|uniref:Glycosyl transferase family 2 n=1 Tax=Xenorhabdus koppenhoeferi TaxID=351659 RepID=A0A1I7J4X1_9GAMM|nr:glycosyltransferase [Xenorhabdus koppenhoeferi]SFU80236.1 Glycosyl transferase family 2 [Xenorhabdus koppenhoeferi]